MGEQSAHQPTPAERPCERPELHIEGECLHCAVRDLADENAALREQVERLRTAQETTTRHLDALCKHRYETRYEGDDEPCSACYQAVVDAQAVLTEEPNP